MSKCKFCDAEIDFIRTVSGGNMPVEPERVSHDELKDGEIIITRGGNTIKVDERIRMPSVVGHRPHWPACFGADKARRSR